MDIPNQDPAPGTREHFLAVTQLQRWGTDLLEAMAYALPASRLKSSAE